MAGQTAELTELWPQFAVGPVMMMMARWRRGAVPATAVTALLLVVAGSCRSGCRDGREEGTEGRGQSGGNSNEDERAVTREKEAAPGTLADLARAVGLTFPPSARLVGQHREAGLDDYLQFKVEIEAAELAAFEASSPIPKQAMEPGEGGLMGPDHDFWDPHRATSLRTGQKSLPGARVLNVGIAESGGGKVALYIVNHGT